MQYMFVVEKSFQCSLKPETVQIIYKSEHSSFHLYFLLLRKEKGNYYVSE